MVREGKRKNIYIKEREKPFRLNEIDKNTSIREDTAFLEFRNNF